MGADTFLTTCWERDAQQAFSTAARQAAFENGHSGYTGSLAEKREFTIIQREPLPIEAAEALAEQLMDNGDPRIRDKWGPAGALPLVDKGSVKDGQRSYTTTLDPAKYTGDWSERSKLKTLFELHVDLPQGAILTGVEIEKDERQYKAVAHKRSKLKGETRYFIEGGLGGANWERGYPSMAVARQEALKLAEKEPNQFEQGPRTFNIYGITRREDGSPMDVIERQLVKRKVKLVGRYVIPTSDQARTAGWLFFGWASS